MENKDIQSNQGLTIHFTLNTIILCNGVWYTFIKFFEGYFLN